MPEMPNLRMTVDEFLAWAETQPGRHELVDGRVFAMAPERARHTRAKAAAHASLAGAIARASRPCEVMPNGMTVRIDRSTAYEPDGLVYCGSRLPDDAIEVSNPIIVVEVLSPSTGNYDKAGKLVGYFMVESLQHYLIVDPDRRASSSTTGATARTSPPASSRPAASSSTHPGSTSWSRRCWGPPEQSWRDAPARNERRRAGYERFCRTTDPVAHRAAQAAEIIQILAKMARSRCPYSHPWARRTLYRRLRDGSWIKRRAVS
ncbi:MAG TPA: Uma2 family endonuclease [Lichenihabitans sp.]|jgi:Uma2 family endonuclease|nr:Uma2 family endonuclease [Lichenihabitans sp.]